MTVINRIEGSIRLSQWLSRSSVVHYYTYFEQNIKAFIITLKNLKVNQLIPIRLVRKKII